MGGVFVAGHHVWILVGYSDSADRIDRALQIGTVEQLARIAEALEWIMWCVVAVGFYFVFLCWSKDWHTGG
jgi:hypothetical protein